MIIRMPISWLSIMIRVLLRWTSWTVLSWCFLRHRKNLRSKRIALLLLVGRTRRSRGFLPFPAWTTLLSVCTNCICRLWLFDTTGFYAPSMAHNTSPMRPCMGVVVFSYAILQTLSSFVYAVKGKSPGCAGFCLWKLSTFICAYVARCTRLYAC